MLHSVPLMQSVKLHWIQNMQCPFYVFECNLQSQCLIKTRMPFVKYICGQIFQQEFLIWSFFIFSLSLSTLLQCLNKDWIINWLGLSDIQQCFRPPYLYTLIFTSDLMFKKKILSGLYKKGFTVTKQQWYRWEIKQKH